MLTGKLRSLSQTGPSAVLARIERAVRCTEDFRLSFVRCDDPDLEEKASAQLLARLRGKRILELRLERPIASLLAEVAARATPTAPPAAVLVRGLTHSLPEGEPAPLLERLEAELDSLQVAISSMTLVWLPEAALRRIEREAPLLWETGSTVYELIAPGALRRMPAPTSARLNGGPKLTSAVAVEEEEAALVTEIKPAEPEVTVEVPAPASDEIAAPEEEAAPVGVQEKAPARAEGPQEEEAEKAEEERPHGLPPLHTLTLAQKQAEIDLRMNRLRESGPEGGIEAQRLQASLLYQIGLLYASLAEWGRAAAALEESAALFNIVEDRRARGSALLQLGVTRQSQGKLDDAEGLYDLALKIARETEDRATEAVALHQVAMVEQARGRVESATARFEESLALKREIGDRRGISASLHQLGALRQRQGDLAGAIRLYRESLQIKEDLDDRPGAAATLHQLGTAEHQQGRLEEAMRYYDESLRIKRAVGDRAGTAITLGQIGRIHQQRGRMREALQHYATSWMTFRALESPYAPLAQKLIRSIYTDAGPEQFEAWLKGDLRSIASQIRRALEGGE